MLSEVIRRNRLRGKESRDILRENEERERERSGYTRPGKFLSSHSIRFHYACLLEGLGRRRSLACTSGSTGIKMSIVDIVSACKRCARLAKEEFNEQDKTVDLRGTNGKERGRGKKEKRAPGLPF